MRALKRAIAARLAKLLGVANIYEAGRMWSTDRSYIPGHVRDVRFDADPLTRWEIVRKARYWERNSAIVNRLVDIFEQYTVGANGLALIPSSSDEEWNKRASEWWDGWCKNCDLTSRHPFSVIQSLIAREWFIDGEVFIVKTYGENAAPGFPQRPRIQLIESHRVATPDGTVDNAAIPTMVEGIELNKAGRPIAYNIKSGDAFSRIVADNIEHIYEPSRVGQYRGLSFLYPVMNDLHDLEDLQLLEMKAAKNAAKVTNVIKTQTGELTDDDVIKQRFSRTTTNSQGVQTSEMRERYYKQVFGGDEVVLKVGDEIEQFASNRPTVTTQAYWDYITSKVCAGVGISKLLVLPYTLQGTVTRSDLEIANAFFRARSSVLAAAFERIYEWAIGWAVLNEPSLAKFPPDWKRVTCRPPRAVNVDVGRNSTAMLEELKAGTRTFQDIYAENGEDYREQLRQRAREAKMLKSLATEFGVDPQQIAELAVAPTPAPVPQTA